MKGAIHSVLSGLLLSILEEECRNRKSFQSSFVQLATSSIVVPKFAKAIVSDATRLASIAKFAVEAVRGEVSVLTRGSVFIVFPSPLPSWSDSSTDNEKSYREEKVEKCKLRRKLASSILSNKRSWSIKGFLARSKQAYEKKAFYQKISHLR